MFTAIKGFSHLYWHLTAVTYPCDHARTFKTTLTSQRRCSEYPAEWSPQVRTTLPLPVPHWGASSPEGPNRWQYHRWCHDSHSHAREIREMRCSRSRRRPALCHGQPPSPRQWNLRDKRETDLSMIMLELGTGS